MGLPMGPLSTTAWIFVMVTCNVLRWLVLRSLFGPVCFPVFGGLPVGRPLPGDGFGDDGKVFCFCDGPVSLTLWSSFSGPPGFSVFVPLDASTSMLQVSCFTLLLLFLVTFRLHMLCSYPAMEVIDLKL